MDGLVFTLFALAAFVGGFFKNRRRDIPEDGVGPASGCGLSLVAQALPFALPSIHEETQS
jgi:hypothetical protein